ncbi:uncharacterized protein K452DRAFT_308501 [Aplosporella prunicola CBS 121167]|uniref:Diphthamide biosynthesis protein 4 n=1 Tax=Aplosporella prunicola CBS 121167 TaxID=1176127 RepID=A0A6A6BFF6_9PEZI|nr:uncharacterized protein K452DRAFT_308501 [Aplosporella prunicola CBS 121167]KAF2142113.1 hypothetical protein K452DRAFT_308501 [Aplosporella prunicola CBS 121167]
MPTATAPAPLPPSFNAYRTLGLAPHPAPPPDAQALKAAYRRALLACHPDKAHGLTPTDARELATIDDITLAYRTLSTPSLRAEHDRALRLRCSATTNNNNNNNNNNNGAAAGEADHARLGLELVDLDDMAFDEGKGVWWRGCRCGEERGFVVGEGELEEGVLDGDAGVGEVLVGCGGCSLWVRVGFGVEVEGEGEGE